MAFLSFLHRVSAGSDLSSEEAHQAMSALLEGEATVAQIAAFLVALKMKGERAAELAGFARAMREKATRVDPGLDGDTLLDSCGTGGDGLDTFNISTVAAFVMAGAGARVAKHGNRSISSRCGSADVLETLGVRIALTPDEAAKGIREAGIGFLFAPALHPAMKFAQPARVELKMRTVFNLLGPLANPAGAQAQVIGAPSEEALELMAAALMELGTGHAFVVHGLDGLDEISTTGPTLVAEVQGSRLQKHVWTPADFGISRARITDLEGGGAERNAEIAEEVLAGRPGPRRDIVLVNAAAGLVAAGLAPDLRSGMEKGQKSIDCGGAFVRLQRLRRLFPA
jgi:anthranilate phosphoribosyltransferase